jgi:DinB family
MTYRNNEAVGALLDEYQRAIKDLKKVLKKVSDEALLAVVDAETPDENCRSIQTILAHVVRSGYGYAIYVRHFQGEKMDFKPFELLSSAEAYNKALDKMFVFNVKLFADYPHLPLEEFEDAKKVPVRWGQKYDVEQLFEHAIVHILRHRRQIERFLLRLKANINES